jgi:hypothetical protein
MREIDRHPSNNLANIHEDDDPCGVIAEHADRSAIFSRGSTLF